MRFAPAGRFRNAAPAWRWQSSVPAVGFLSTPGNRRAPAVLSGLAQKRF
jgi:hypothetical protein